MSGRKRLSCEHRYNRSRREPCEKKPRRSGAKALPTSPTPNCSFAAGEEKPRPAAAGQGACGSSVSGGRPDADEVLGRVSPNLRARLSPRTAGERPSSTADLAAPRKETPNYPPQRQTLEIPRPSPVSGDGDQVLINETPPFRGISSATRFRMRQRLTGWLGWQDSNHCISKFGFRHDSQLGREMGIRPTAIARREEWQQTVHGLAAGACRTCHRLSKQPSERGAIAQA